MGPAHPAVRVRRQADRVLGRVLSGVLGLREALGPRHPGWYLLLLAPEKPAAEQRKCSGTGHLPGLSETWGHFGQERRVGFQGSGRDDHLELCGNSRAAWPVPVPSRAARPGHACSGRGQEGLARPGAALHGAAPPRYRRGPRSPGRGATLPPSGRERRRAVLQHPQAPGRWRKEEAAAAARKSGGASLLGCGSRGRRPPSGPAVVAAAAAAAAGLGAHPGPWAAGARAEAREARQHPLPRPRAERSQPSPGARHSESPRGAGGSGATRAPGPGRRAAPLPPRSRRPLGELVQSWGGGGSGGGAGEGRGEGAPLGTPTRCGGRRRSAGATCRGPRGPTFRHRAAIAAWKLWVGGGRKDGLVRAFPLQARCRKLKARDVPSRR